MNPQDMVGNKYGKESVVATLRRVRRGKATGPFANSTDTLRELGLKRDKDNDEYRHAV